MKKILIFMTVSIMACGCAASADRLISDFQDFIDNTEREMDTFTEEDWAKAEEEFNALTEKYREQADKLTEEQKKAVEKAIGEYWGIITRSSTDNFIEKAKKVLENIPDKIEGFIDGLTDENDAPENGEAATAPEGETI